MSKLTPELKAEIVAMAKEGMSVLDIVAELEIQAYMVYRVLREEGVTSTKEYAPGSWKALPPEKQLEVIELYQNTGPGSVPVNQIVEDYGITYANLYQMLAAYGVNSRRRTWTKRARTEAMEVALELYESTSMPIAQITAETGIHQPTLHAEIHKRGIPLRMPRYDYSVIGRADLPQPIRIDDDNSDQTE